MKQVRYKVDTAKTPRRKNTNSARIKVRRWTAPMVAQIKNTSFSRNIVAEIWDQWPGEESIGQLLDMLRSSKGVS
ncbi:MAG: hypothetical protein ONB46_16600 [candidate division KSB1 bacterium]|nr:hypothetical protein [candidate division KSB1 bacterium]MDZ7367388.1 hypothetical protein [candidate division KSB1 bacterium]MDZ7405269.1 hypothetical protein [candidate division KSB1 bacterium]